MWNSELLSKKKEKNLCFPHKGYFLFGKTKWTRKINQVLEGGKLHPQGHVLFVIILIVLRFSFAI